MSDLLYADDPGADAIRLFDLREKRLVSTFETTQGRPSSFAFSPDAVRLVTGMSDGAALVWDLSGETSK
ncbi:MAG TPA: hypothetical protein VFW87_25150 [Pirellulales bacterium]|nr:hypothetical protein [Pirellulales bacterium]